MVNQGLNITLMREVFAAARTKFQKGFKETQNIRSYALQKNILSRAVTESPEHGFEWTIRVKAAQGSTQRLNPFQQVEYVRDTYDVSLKATPATRAHHLNMQFDNLAKRINNGAMDKLWSDYKMKASAAEESLAEMWESELLQPGTDGGDNEIRGLLYIFRRSMTSGGVFVQQIVPARNGVYYVDNAGTVSAEMWGKTISNAAYSRLRTLVATHGGTLGPVELESLRRGVKVLGYEYLDDLKGDKSTTDPMLYWDEDFDDQYDQIVTALGGPRQRDYFDSGETTVRSIKTVRVPSFNNHFLRPIFVLNHAEVKFRKESGGWRVEGEQQLTHNAFAFPEDSTGQLWAENPTVAGLFMHGEFTTGT